MSMVLTLELQQDESPDQAMIRMLLEQAEGKDGAYRSLVHQVAALAERALRTPPESLHPSVTPDLTRDERMSRLALTFPTLENADGLEPWDHDRFFEWLQGPAPGGGARHAGRFVLGVWNRASFEVTSDDVRMALGLDRTVRSWGDPEPLTFDDDWPPPATLLRTALSFDAMAAFGTWDGAHRAAFIAWARHPWFG